jgi:alcohol dehydrogenase (quinone), cytochrome c subunit
MQRLHASHWQWLGILAVAGCGGGMQQAQTSKASDPYDVIQHGRQMVVQHDCGACHGGGQNPAAPGWLAGARGAADTIPVGPFKTRPRNLTPDATGTGRYTERQIFNSLRFGLLLSSAPDAEITSAVPGQGNFPTQPKYMAPSMPWVGWRHMSDDELRAIAAYLKRGLKPVINEVTPSDAPPDFWASEYTAEKVGPYPAPAYPTEREIPVASLPAGAEQKVMRGRFLVLSHACGGCHGSSIDPSDSDWLGGITRTEQEWQIGPFKTRPRNLTPDNTTGMGRFSERQIFNALRFGLRPGETPDVDITGTTPGQGNFPVSPKFLAPPMPWPAWRHMPDDDLWAIAAYLKHGVKPFRNRVADSEGPPDFWASEYTLEKMGPRPAVPFPTQNEVAIR